MQLVGRTTFQAALLVSVIALFLPGHALAVTIIAASWLVALCALPVWWAGSYRARHRD